jgi:hypothetical protein
MSSREPISIVMSEDGKEAFRQGVDFLLKNSEKVPKEALRFAAWYFIRAGMKGTPKARKNAKRKLIQLNRNDGKKRGRTWAAISLQQNAPPHAIPIEGSEGLTKSEVKRNSIAAVPHIGASKFSWYGALRDIGKGIDGRGPNLSGVEEGKSRGEQRVIIRNRLNYLFKIAPGIDTVALRKAGKALVIYTERKMGYHKW